MNINEDDEKSRNSLRVISVIRVDFGAMHGYFIMLIISFFHKIVLIYQGGQWSVLIITGGFWHPIIGVGSPLGVVWCHRLILKVMLRELVLLEEWTLSMGIYEFFFCLALVDMLMLWNKCWGIIVERERPFV